jgi:O-methyltransferase involved in polyketide biosynthesis
MDYTKPGQIQALLAHGLQPARRTLVTWEANTYYLPDDVLRTVLRTLSEMLPDLTVAVDYMSPEVIRGESASPWLKTIVPRLRTMGAPWLGSIEDMSRLAGDCGLEVAEEHSFGALKDRLLPHLDIGADRDAEYRFCILTRPRSSPPAS